MSRTGQDIGKKFEKALESAFEDLKKSHGFNYHKFVDTHAAGNVVASQPSDYLVTLPTGLAYLEAKASTKVPRFRQSMLRPAQRRTIMYDSQILGVPYYILFYNEDTDTIDLIDGAESLRSSRINWSKSLLASCKSGDLPSMLEKVFKLECISETLRRYNKEYK